MRSARPAFALRGLRNRPGFAIGRDSPLAMGSVHHGGLSVVTAFFFAAFPIRMMTGSSASETALRQMSLCSDRLRGLEENRDSV